MSFARVLLANFDSDLRIFIVLKADATAEEVLHPCSGHELFRTVLIWAVKRAINSGMLRACNIRSWF